MVALRSWSAVTSVLICFASIVTSATAANLTLFTSAPSNAPLIITPLDASRQLLVSVANDTSGDPPTEFMSAWQFWLQAIPDASTTGTLNAVGGTVPDNYVFADAPRLGPAIASLPDDPSTLNALDIVFSLDSAAQIPTAPGENLLSMSFAPSADALGRFGIYVVDLHTLWVDSTNSGGLRTFANVPRDDGKVRIGDVLVTSVADYNRDGVVDAADYTVWRDTLGSTTNLLADGNGNEMIDADDYEVWKLHFGVTVLGFAAGSGALDVIAVPEPATCLLLLLAAISSGIISLQKRIPPGVYSQSSVG
jgi:hypothetical protein